MEVGCFEERLKRMKDGEEASELKWEQKGVSGRLTERRRANPGNKVYITPDAMIGRVEAHGLAPAKVG